VYETVSRLAAIPETIPLSNEKFDRLLGLWIHPFVGNKFLHSPLIDSRLAAYLNDRTRKGVHATLAMEIISRRRLQQLDVITCHYHFVSAGLLDQATIILVQALTALIDLDSKPVDDWGISHTWISGAPEQIDINLRLMFRSLQIVAIDARDGEITALTADLDRLIVEGGDTAWGVVFASSLLAIRLYSKRPQLANSYLLIALRFRP